MSEMFSNSALVDLVKQFLARFKNRAGRYQYVDAIDEMMPRNAKHIRVDYNDLVTEPEIDALFTKNPDRILKIFSISIKEVLGTRFPDYAEEIKDTIHVSLVNYPMELNLRQINAETIGMIICVSGMVVNVSDVKSLAKKLFYVCPDGHTTVVNQENRMNVPTPARCDDSECKHRDFELKPEKSKFTNFQILRLQELPEDLSPGQQPYYIDVTIKQDLAGRAMQGDMISVTGLVRVVHEPVASVKGRRSGQYRLRIEGNNIEPLRDSRVKRS